MDVPGHMLHFVRSQPLQDQIISIIKADTRAVNVGRHFWQLLTSAVNDGCQGEPTADKEDYLIGR